MSVESCLQDGELLSDILPIFFKPYCYAFLFLRLTWVQVMQATVSVGKPHQPLPGYLLQLLQGVAGLDGGWNPSSVWVWVRTSFSWTCLERFPKDSSESFAFELNFFLTESAEHPHHYRNSVNPPAVIFLRKHFWRNPIWSISWALEVICPVYKIKL